MPKATKQTSFETAPMEINEAIIDGRTLEAMNKEAKELIKHKSIKQATKRLIGL